MSAVTIAHVCLALDKAKVSYRLMANPDTPLSGPIAWDQFDGHGLAFYANADPEPLRRWNQTNQGLIICPASLVGELDEGPFVMVDDVRLAFILAARLFLPIYKPGIHPTAIVDPKAKVGSRVSIGPYSVVGSACIGDDCVIGARVYLSGAVELGQQVVIMNGADLGEPGLGSIMHGDSQYLFPHFERLLVGDHAVVGPHTVINRGSLKPTVIGRSVHISSSCVIAHNATLGELCFLAPGVHIGGSAKLGQRCFIGMGACIKDGISLADRTTVGMNAAVSRSCPEPGITLLGPNAKQLGRVLGLARE